MSVREFKDIEEYDNMLCSYNIQAQPEIDFGMLWKDGVDFPWRASFQPASGDFLIVSKNGVGRVQALAQFDDIDELETAIKGWEIACGLSHSLHWLTVQVQMYVRNKARTIRLQEAI